MKKIIYGLLFGFWLGISGAFSQTVQRVEYFIDSDPGFGQGTAISFSAGTEVTIPLQIPLLPNLSNGFHKIFVRAQDSDGVWGQTYMQVFYKSGEIAGLSACVALEYFIDQDPGYGLATGIPISAQLNQSKALHIALPQALPFGFHRFFIRARDVAGRWSVVYAQNFYKTNELPQLQDVVKLEYFVDHDPGFGLANDLPLTNATQVSLSDVTFNLGNTTLGGGEHRLFVRAMDALGRWSIVGKETFVECDFGAFISAVPNATSCGDSITLSANFQENGNTLSWKWMKDDEPIFGSDNKNPIKVGESGLYRMRVSSTPASVCGAVNFSNTVQVNILKEEFLKISTLSDLASCDQPAVLQIDPLLSSFSDELGLSYSWFRNGVPIPGASSSSFAAQQGGIYTLRIAHGEGLAACGFLESNAVQVGDKTPFVRLSPVSQSPNKIVVCSGAQIDLTSETNLEGNLSYQWFKNGTPLNGQNEATLTLNNAPGVYKLKITSGICPVVESPNYTLSYASGGGSPLINLVEGDLASCPGSLAKLSVSACAGEVLWNTGFSGEMLDVIQQNESFTYKANCVGTCISPASGTKTFTPLPSVYPEPEIAVAEMPFDTSVYLVEKVYDLDEMGGFIPSFKFIQFEGGGFLSYNAFGNSLKIGESTYPISVSKGIAGLQLENGNFLFAVGTAAGVGHGKSMASFGGSDIWVFSTNLQGEILWDAAFGGTANESFSAILPLSNGNFLICGNSNSAVNGNKTADQKGGQDFYVICIDAEGNKIWEKSYGGDQNETLSTAFQAANGNILLGGGSRSGIGFDKTAAPKGEWLVVINPENGNLITEKSFGKTGAQEFETNVIGSIAQVGVRQEIFIGSRFEPRVIKLANNYTLSQYFEVNPPFTYQAYNYFLYKELVKILPTWDGNLLLFFRAEGRANNGNDLAEFSVIGSYETNQFGTYQNGSLNLNGFCGENEFVDIQTDRLGETLVSFLGFESGPFGVYDPPNDDRNCGTCYASGRVNFKSCELVGTPSFFIGQRYFGGVYKLKRIDFQNRRYTDFCKPKYFVVNASIPYQMETDTLRNVEFLWSDGQTGATRTYTANEHKPLYVSYKVKNAAICGSQLGSIDLLPYGDKLVLQGLNQIDSSRKFAYKQLISSEKNEIKRLYQSEGQIQLEPGFEIKATAGRSFRAEIAGCENNSLPD
ncbi:hypothetical protein LAG90_16280 [Marinilongibacter aquaticus]|uniref:hypothetical protein n=1 Tax=Marinilongibacter aquaticus TaxID=2975157 RepID=UPI0021BD257F|nr:hypothetical protein [Marinilongibacter aquaticus]UBM58362.1 hypothetical protein LAG90_16280 [Marinilongibacter aquaticus]